MMSAAVRAKEGQIVRWRRVVFGVVVELAGLWWVLQLADPQTADVGWALSVAFSAACVAALVPHTVAHELGHLVVAVVLRLPVLGVRIGPLRLGTRRPGPAEIGGYVLVDPSAVRRWVPLRMGTLAAAGPLANLGIAAVAGVLAGSTDLSTTARVACVALCVGGAVLGIDNLFPRQLSGGWTNDGFQLLKWILRPADGHAEVATGRAIKVIRDRPTSGTVPIETMRAALVTALRDPRPQVAVAAMKDLLRTRDRYDDGWRDVEEVQLFLDRADVDPTMRAAVGGVYARALAMARIRAGANGAADDPDGQRLALLSQLAERAHAIDGYALNTRTALALVRLLQGRPGEARREVLDIGGSDPAALRAEAFAVRGLAEAALGDLDSARRCAATASAHGPRVLVQMLATAIARSAEPEADARRQ